MIDDKVSRVLVIILILADILHSVTIVAFGNVWLSNVFMFLSEVLWLSVLLCLFFYANKYEQEFILAASLFVLCATQFFIVILQTMQKPFLHGVISNLNFVISAIQIIATFIAGFTLKKYKDKPMHRFGIVLMVQSLLYLVLFVSNNFFSYALSRQATMDMMMTAYGVFADALEIFILIYAYKVFCIRYEDTEI